MFTRVGYATVGLFVIVLGAALIAAGLWLSTDMSGREYDRYSIYFTESVTGLSANATVRYRGVDVGRVERIELDQQQPERVHLLVDIETTAPIRRDTRARLSTQGLTGVSHVELTGGSRNAPPPEHPRGEPYPVIPSAPSLFSRLDDALTRGVSSLDRISQRLERLLADDNLDHLNNTLANLDSLTGRMLAHSGRLDRILNSTENLLTSGNRLTDDLNARLPRMIEQVDTTMDGVNTMTHSLSEAGTEVANATRGGSEDLSALTTTLLPQLTSLLQELESVSTDLGSLTRELSDNPSLLIYGRPERPPGPGEE